MLVGRGPVSRVVIESKRMKVSRLLRYRLRTAIAVTAVIACCFSWLTNRANQNRERRQAVERIWRLGGSIGFAGERVFDRPTSDSDWAIVVNREAGFMTRYTRVLQRRYCLRTSLDILLP